MIKRVSAMEIRQNLGEILNGVQYRGDSVVITKTGKPVAALVDMELFEKIRRMKEQFIAMTDELGQAYDGVDEGVAEQEIAEALKHAKGKNK